LDDGEEEFADYEEYKEEEGVEQSPADEET
jgi:hypothetical protein